MTACTACDMPTFLALFFVLPFLLSADTLICMSVAMVLLLPAAKEKCLLLMKC